MSDQKNKDLYAGLYYKSKPPFGYDAPNLTAFKFNGPPLTRWQMIRSRLRWKIKSIRERLGEIVAGRSFDD